MENSKRKKIIISLSAFVVVLLTVFVLILTGVIDFNREKKDPLPDEQPPVVEPDEQQKLFEEYRKIWSDNHAINSDYIGEVKFDSGLINVSFVQAKSTTKPNGEPYKFYNENGTLVTDPTGYNGNDVYIWTYWQTGEYDYNDHGGSTFMDYRNEITDQNLIIYGHHFSVWNDETRQKAFTPLEKLLEEENYPDNRFVTLILENEVRHYELVAVYNFDATDDYYYDNLQYWRTTYNYDDFTDTVDNGYYQNYIDNVKKIALYDTGVKLTPSDKTLTLQTCISGFTGELFEILVFRETAVEPY